MNPFLVFLILICFCCLVGVWSIISQGQTEDPPQGAIIIYPDEEDTCDEHSSLIEDIDYNYHELVNHHKTKL